MDEMSVASLIAFYTNKVIDVIVKSSICKTCSHWEKKQETEKYYQWLMKHGSKCLANIKGVQERWNSTVFGRCPRGQKIFMV
ncbi:hypothetical protein J437_LFUL017812 [Ladona fulva]|uniref:Uncharacterized protein n=1 Tax=Ladona fulva TaxID=123851 RepID=A0A8K0PAV8_LADFU|nr:hypothetical protein J437_LFUL017812 [Ladona fulva]